MIHYIDKLTIEEQLDQWAVGNAEEAKLEKWLRQHLVDIEDRQSADCTLIESEAKAEGHDEGYREGYAVGMKEGARMHEPTSEGSG